jgi:hypothetical protein
MEKTPSNILRIPYIKKIFPEAKYLYLIREPLAYLSSAEYKWQIPIYMNKAWRRLKETPKIQLPHYVGRFFWDHFSKRVLRHKYVSIWGVRYKGIYEDLKRYDTAQVIAKQWVFCSKQAEEDLASLDLSTVTRMRYEDFVADPVSQFRRISQHFGLEMTAAMAERVKETVDAGRQDKWRRLEVAVVDKCLPLLEEEMAHHGYKVPADIGQVINERQKRI